MYELWDTETGNSIEVFDSEAAALEAVRELTVLNAGAYPGALALGQHQTDGKLRWLAAGADLANRAEACA